MRWSECPSCSAVIVDAARHGARCSGGAAWVAHLAALTPPDAVTGGRWDGAPVAPMPPLLGAATVDSVRAQAALARAQITEQAIPALDAYLAITAPTTAQALAQVRVLTTVVRGLAVAVRALIRLATRHLED